MDIIRPAVLTGLISLLSVAAAQTPDDIALMKKVTAATAAAPASRVTSTITDRDSGAVVETVVLERVPPEAVHFVTTRHGQPRSEMISDGQRSLHRAGPNEPWKPLPTNLSKMMNASHKNFDEEQLKEEHARLKPVGDDQINGVAAKVYEMSTDDGSSKVWIAADTSRILKVERDYEGEVSTSRPKMSADLKTLQAQLKAATAQHHLHSVANFVYDPSIKITMPAP